MTALLEWILDLRDIRLDRDAPLLLKWSGALPAWVLFCFALVAIAWVALIYRREPITPGRRVTLAVVRVALVALVVAVLCKPVLVWQKNRVERAYVALAVDTSQSMGIEEAYADESLAKSIVKGAKLESAEELESQSRLALVQRALCDGESEPLATLVRSNALQFATFSSILETHTWAFDEGNVEAVADALRDSTADGSSTQLADAIDRLIDNAQGRHLAAIVVATDGRATSSGHLTDALARASDRKIPIYPLVVGSPRSALDIEVGALRAEPRVFVHDYFSIDAQVSVFGLEDTITFDVRLIEEQTGDVVDVEPVTLDSSRPTVTVELQAKPESPGRKRYRVEVEPLPNERTPDNNRNYVDISVLKNQVHVLYVEAYPRFEYRYLKNALLREKTVRLGVLLLEADESFVQEGTEPIRRFPETPEELDRYDVVLFGDVDPRAGWLTVAQMNMLVSFVGQGGGGFGLIAGERASPQRFQGTVLEKIIPVRIDPTFQGVDEAHSVRGYQPRLTPEGVRSRLFRIVPQSPDDGATKEAGTLPGVRPDLLESFPELHWLARTMGPKPGATVLAEHATMLSRGDVFSGSGRMPVVVVGRYGAGATLFQATDDSWRWRRGGGEFYHDTYWLQMVRTLMRADQVAQDKRYVIRTDRRVYEYGEPVQVQVEILDSQLLAGGRKTVELAVSQAASASSNAGSGASHRNPANLAGVHQLEAHSLGSNSNLFEGTLVPAGSGSFVVGAVSLGAESQKEAPSASFRVARPDLEFRHPEADHDTLALMAEATGGQLITLDRLSEGLSVIQDESVRIPDDVVEPLWDSKLVLILFVCLITLEWVLRKAYGLL